MRLTRLVALLLTLAVPCGAYAQRSKQPRPPSRTTSVPQPPPPRPSLPPSPPQMSFEKAFYYFVAIYGQPGDLVDLYGKFFDAGNYERAMADEFERNRYREQILARIADGVRKVDFNDKFTLVAQATLGEYSFGSHSFPFVWNLFPAPRFCIHRPWYPCRREFIDLSAFRVQDAVNGSDFNWSLPMSEADASAFVKSRSAARVGDVDRLIMVRIIYSVVNKKGSYAQHYTFSPFIFSVEAYSDQSLTRQLGVVPKINSLHGSTVEESRLALVAAQTPTKEIGRYVYFSDNGHQSYALATITLTDVGIELSGEQPHGPPEKQTRTFYQVFEVVKDWDYYKRTGIRFSRTEQGWGVEVEPCFVGSCYGSYSQLQFRTQEERDRFLDDVTKALQAWTSKYPQFATAGITIR
jgi:hypothetical protein